MIKGLILTFFKQYWFCKCRINFWLYGPYGVCRQLSRSPYPFIQPILKRYGATIGKKCVIDTGLVIHRPAKDLPFKNLIINDDVYMGHENLIDLSGEVIIQRNVAIGARCQFWTHTGDFSEVLRDNDDYKEKIKPVIIGESTIIYSNVLISAGTRVAERSRIGAGSVVLKDTESGYFYGGVPAVKLMAINKQFYN